MTTRPASHWWKRYSRPKASKHAKRPIPRTHALEILKTWTPDVILLDIQLHGLDNGLECARRLQANLATRATSIVAFTAFGDRWSEAEARAAGCEGFLEKPITAKMLAEAVRTSVEKTG